MSERNRHLLYAHILYKHRKWRGLTQAALGDFLGYSAKVIQRMETGHRVPMEPECLLLQEVLDIKRDALLEACRAHWFQGMDDTAEAPRPSHHASVNTTGRYDRRPEEAKKQAAARLHYPYKRQER